MNAKHRMEFSFVHVVCWLSLLQCRFVAQAGRLKSLHYCVETEVQGIEQKNLVEECVSKVKQTTSNGKGAVDEAIADTFKKAINFDVIQAFQARKTCTNYTDSDVLCLRMEKNKTEITAIISVETPLSLRSLGSLLESTGWQGTCQPFGCYGFKRPNISRVGRNKCERKCRGSEIIV